jgi:sugar phosphate isomerase/epimerase
MKLSLFTVSFAGFWGQEQLSLEQAIDKTAELGFDGIEIMAKRPHLSSLDYDIEACHKLRERIEERGLSVAALGGYTNFTGGADSGEVPFVEMQISYIEQLAAQAAALGTPFIRIFASYERSDVPFAKQWQTTVTAIRECCDRAAQYGVSIGLQNHHDIGADTKALCELLKQVNRDNLIPFYDCWNIHLRGEDIAAGVEKLGSQMKFTTVADYITIPRSKYCVDLVNYADQTPPYTMAVPMGEGELDYQTFFNGLQQQGFDGWVSYETCSPLRDGGSLETIEAYAKTFIDYMQPYCN